MAQVSWVFLDDFGGQHRVGLYHGDRSGHLVIHCNLRVIQIDFSVKESKTYSFFIEDELCEVQLVKEPNGVFSYGFEVNKKVDTPLNRLRRVEEKQNRRSMLILIACFAGILVAAVFGLKYYGNWQRERRLATTSMSAELSAESQHMLQTQGQTAQATLFVMRENSERRIFYTFDTQTGDHISAAFSAPDTGLILLPNGFPLVDNAGFQVTYLPGNPRVHRVDFNQPSPGTLEQYLQRAVDSEQHAHPDQTPGHSLCIVGTILKQKSWESLATVIFQTATPAQNARHNHDAYLRLIRDAPMEAALKKECWDK